MSTSSRFPASPVLATACVALAGLVAWSPPAALGQGRREARPAVVESTLMAEAADVFEALQQALSTWRIRRASLEEGVVRTDWHERERGREAFRGRVVAEFRAEGYAVRLSVRHERQRRMSEFQPTLGHSRGGWQDWDGDVAVASAVVRSVEEALGLVPEIALPGSRDADRAPRETVRVIEPCDPLVSPAAAARIHALKARRREVVREIKAMDARILGAFQAGQVEVLAPEMDGLRSRKSSMEQVVVEIDREILALILAD